MLVAPPTKNEEARIALLHALDLLDTPAEDVFDRITQLAASILEMPIALVSLVDTRRQWFKSRYGLDTSETPRDVALCAHAIHGTEPFIINDATLDPRFADNPLVLEAPKVRFYAGAPLLSARRLPLGTLCVIDHIPRALTDRQIDILKNLTELARREIMHREAALLARSATEIQRRTIADNEQRFQIIFEQAPIGILLVALDGRWLRANRKLCELTGFTEAELLAQHGVTRNRDGAAINTEQQSFTLVSSETNSHTYIKRMVRKDGSLLWVSSTLALQRDADGNPHQFVAFREDISARKLADAEIKKLRDELELRVQQRTVELRAVIDHAANAFIAFNEYGIISDWNPQAEQMFGWSHVEAIGRSLEETVVVPEEIAAYRAAMQKFIAGDIDVVAHQLHLVRRRDGKILQVEISVSYFSAFTGHHFFMFIQDVNARSSAGW